MLMSIVATVPILFVLPWSISYALDGVTTKRELSELLSVLGLLVPAIVVVTGSLRNWRSPIVLGIAAAYVVAVTWLFG